MELEYRHRRMARMVAWALLALVLYTVGAYKLGEWNFAAKVARVQTGRAFTVWDIALLDLRDATVVRAPEYLPGREPEAPAAPVEAVPAEEPS